MILKLDLKHQAMELYKVYLNYDPGMTLTIFYSKASIGRLCIRIEKLLKWNLKDKTVRKWVNELEI